MGKPIYRCRMPGSWKPTSKVALRDWMGARIWPRPCFVAPRALTVDGPKLPHLVTSPVLCQYTTGGRSRSHFGGLLIRALVDLACALRLRCPIGFWQRPFPSMQPSTMVQQLVVGVFETFGRPEHSSSARHCVAQLERFPQPPTGAVLRSTS